MRPNQKRIYPSIAIATCGSLCLLLLWGGHALGCEVNWSNFIATPSPATHDEVNAALDRCRREGHDASVLPGDTEAVLLTDLIEANDPLAVDLAFAVIGVQLPGAYLEDIYRALGRVADASPEAFLAGAFHHGVSEKALGKVACMLPLEVVDDPRRIKLRLMERVRRIDTVSNGPLTPVKGQMKIALTKCLAKTHNQ